jgi:multidrug efflux system outer membrane protein
MSARAIIFILSSVLLAGCAVGPNYRRPPVDAPGAFRGQDTAGTNSLGEEAWWEVYHDPKLQTLIRIALTNNYDARIAVTRIDQARAAAAQARSQFFPAIGYQFEPSRGRNTFGGNPNPAGTGGTASSYEAYLGAAWEADLWGRIRRLNEAARAQFLASQEARRDVLISLTAEVSTAYFELLELDAELEIARRSTNTFGESLRLFNQRLAGGMASKLETSSAEALLATSAAAEPNLERQIALKENQISVLIGRNPSDIDRQPQTLDQTVPPEVPAGLPSALLERRPDIRQAEQLAVSANAQIGAVIGQFLPRIGLSAIYGGVSPRLGDIATHGASLWALAADVSGPLFEGGSLKGQLNQAKAASAEARLRYQQTALTAFQEVADALIDRQKLAEEREQQERAVMAYEEAVKVSKQRYVAGQASYYEVLQAEQQLFPAENALAQTHRDQLLAVVSLYRALGGGWEAVEMPPAPKSGEK